MPDKPFDPIPTRHSLLVRLKDLGDQASWQEFFETYWRLIYNVAFKAGLTDAESQEVVQETIISVARKIPEFKADPARGSFSAWLMRLTRWRIADQFRKRSTPGQWFGHSAADKSTAFAEDTSTDALERIPDPGGLALESVWQVEWEKHVLDAALDRVKRKVKPRQYQMFDMHVMQKLSVLETARTLQASVASVYMARHRTLRLLRREIEQVEKGTLPQPSSRPPH
jgi:RNA polymerase sigma factor (sigma-70 family)